MTAGRPLAGGALMAALGRVSWIIASAAVVVIVARLLGPAGSGQFAVVSTLFFALLVIVTLGLDLGVSWMVGSRRWEVGSALATTALASVVLGILGAALGLAIRAAASGSAFAGVGSEVVLLALVGLPPAVLGMVFIQAALASERYEGAAAIAVAQSVGYVAAVATLASLFELEGAAAGLFVGQLVGAVVAIGWGRRVVSAEQGAGLDAGRLREAITFGVQLYVANALAIIVYRFDVLLVNAYAGNSETGYYAVAIAATTALGVLPAALGSVLFPRLASYTSEQEEGRRQLEDRAIRHTVLILLVSAAALAVALALLVEPVLGSRFAPAVTPGLILIPGAAALGLASILYASLAGRGRPEYSMRIAFTIAPLAVALYFLLVPWLEASGAAIGSDLVYMTSAVLATISLRRLSGSEPARRLLPGRQELRDYRALVAGIRAGSVRT